MTVQVTADDPAGWRCTATDDEPTEVKELAEVLTDQVRSGLRWPPSPVVLRTAVRQARDRALRQQGTPTKKQMGLAFALAKDLLLDRDDRLALAEVVAGRDVESWSDLTWDELSRVIDSMTGYVHVRHLRLERTRAQGQA